MKAEGYLNGLKQNAGDTEVILYASAGTARAVGYNPSMPSYPHIEEYRAKLQEMIEFGGSDNEENIRPAFQNCLDAHCHDHRERLALIPELKTSPGNKPDGTAKDSLRMARGYWETKDSHDDLDAKIKVKFNRGYPRDNIIFENPRTAVLVQNGNEAMGVDMSRDGELHRLIRIFLDYELPEMQEFRHAQSQFKTDLPTVPENLRATVAEAKQQFLKAIYKDFYTAYNPAAADRLGVVYTPNEVVDFIIRGADHLLQKHFGKTLADDNVQILDPATGTGTFVTNLINHLPADRLEHKYRHEIHANEVAILPYYIANLNIEYTYQQRTGRYLEFPNLCFVDTLDNLDWQGATGGAVTRQAAFNLGRLSEENWIRIQEQNEKPISVIIGNPPYNANQQNENDNNKNREYPEIDRRIRETYIASSTAQKTKQYDMYKRFIRWASDRLADDGIIAFITNRAYLQARQDDGFRKTTAQEFTDGYIVDLGSDVRRNPRISGTTHNVFGIQTGVAIGFFVRDKSKLGQCEIHYASREDSELARDKLEFLGNAELNNIAFETITPDAKQNWIDQSNGNFDALIPLADRRTKLAETTAERQIIFALHTLGVSTNRDDWVYDFDITNLREKAIFFADTYNERLDNNDLSYKPIIKWSRDLRNVFQRGRHIVYSEANRIQSLYRPFVVKHHFADFTMNDVLTRNHYEIFGPNLTWSNQVICFLGSGARKPFSVLATHRLPSLALFIDGTQCLPLYRYTEDGERVSNITQWGIDHINGHYRQAWGDDFVSLAGEDGITAEEIFAYTYAVLHDPVYRNDYRVDLLREFPRLPLYRDFHHWAEMGEKLLDLHIGFESAEPYPLERHDREGVDPKRAILRS